MARMKAKAERSAHEATAAEEMAELVSGDTLEKEFDEIGATASSDAVEKKLAEMKSKMGK